MKDGEYAPKEPGLRAPVGSFPRNATPEGVYDLLGYYDGEWCSDRYVLRLADVVAAIRGESERVVRGVHHKATNVTMADVLEERKTAAAKGFFEFLKVAGEPRLPQYHQGYSWTRVGRDEQTGHALLRLAMDATVEKAGARPEKK